MTSTNCQISPSVMQISSAPTSGSSPPSRWLNQGAATQERKPIGSAAAAQTPRILPSEYCWTARISIGLAGLGQKSIVPRSDRELYETTAVRAETASRSGADQRRRILEQDPLRPPRWSMPPWPSDDLEAEPVLHRDEAPGDVVALAAGSSSPAAVPASISDS